MYKYYNETMDFLDKLDGLTSDEEKRQLFSVWEQWLSDHSVKSMDWAYLMYINSRSLFLLCGYDSVLDRYESMVDRYKDMFDQQRKMLDGYEKILDDYCEIFDMIQKLELFCADTTDIPLQ